MSDQLDKMESEYALPLKYDHIYEKLEDIENSEPFLTKYEKFSSKDAKLFYNIFAYVQSHYLMRFGLVAAYYPIANVIFFEFPKTRKLLNLQLADHNSIFEKLTKLSTNKTILEKHHQALPIVSDDVTRLKNNCLNFSSKIMIFANDCRNFDTEFQNLFNRGDKITNSKNERDNFLDILPRLQAIENNFTTCHEEFERFHLSFNKFLNDKYNIPVKIEVNSPNYNKNTVEENHSDTLNVVDETTKEVLHDDFFLVSGGAGDEPNDQTDYKENIINVNNRLVKSYFRPVLNQLKAKIDPINEQMKIKEKEILAAKGIAIDNELLDDDIIDKSTDDEENELHNFLKNKKTQSKFSENRDFLISKTQNTPHFGFMPLPIKSMVNEDIVGND